jgi:HAMP domain-containing protein
MSVTTLVRITGMCLLVGLGLAPAAAAQENAERQARSVDSFTELSFSVPGTVHLRQGEPRSVEVEGPTKALEQLETRVEEGDLHIRSEQQGNWLGWLGGGNGIDEEVKVYVTAPTLTEISIAGSGRIVGETPVEGGSLEVQNAGSGSVDLAVQNDEVEVDVAGSGAVRLRGRTNSFEASVIGAGDVDGADLETATADVSIAGSGDVHLHVTDHLEADLMGSGNVQYRGTPEIETNSAGSGTVESLEQK